MAFEKLLLSITIFTLLLITIQSAPSNYHLNTVELEKWAEDNTSMVFPKNKFQSIPKYVVISDTFMNPCRDQTSCKDLTNYVVDYQKSKNISLDISAHFFIGGDGRVYVGRGWDYVGEYDYGCEYTNATINISFLTTFLNSRLYEVEIEALRQLLEYGVEHKKLSDSYKILGDWELNSNEKYLHGKSNIDTIKKWPHWDANVQICSEP